MADQLITVAADGVALFGCAAAFEETGDSDAECSEIQFGIVRAETNTVIFKVMVPASALLSHINPASKIEITTASAHDGIMSVLQKFTDGGVHAAVQRRSHDLDDAGNIHLKRDFTTPH